MALTRIVSEIIQDNTIENRDISGSFTAGISGSWRGELSSSNMTDVGGGVSGSVTSTGSFGRVEAAGVVFADSFESVTGGATIDFNDNVNLTGNLTATGNISSSFTSTGSFGRVQTTNIDIDSISGNWTNVGNTVADLGIITTADINGGTIDGVTLGTNSAITEAQIDSVNINGSTIKDFSSVSGSSVSTGSFGRVITSTADINGGTIDGITSLTAGGNLDIGAHGFRASTLTADSQTSGRVAIYSTAGLLSEDSDLTFSGATLSATNVTTTGTIKDFASVSGSYVSTGSVGRIQTRAAAIGTITGTTLSVTGNISSSATSTGSVGRLETQQTNASLGGSIINLAGNLTTAGTLTTQNNNVTINAAGAARTLTLNESLTIGDGHDGTITFGAASKTLTIENTSLLNQDLTTDASPTFAGATITGTLTVQEIHTEFESASILFTSGSTQFGNSTDDVHNVTGSMKITGSFQVDNGTLTAGTVDINGGTVDGITSLTAGGDLDIGSHGFRAATITADGLTAGRVPFAGTAGLLSDDSDLTFATATLSATNLTTTGTIKNMALVSGSYVSTGSFGMIGVRGFPGETNSRLAVNGNIEMLSGSNRLFIPRASDGALTLSVFSRTGNNLTLSGAGSSTGQIEFIPSSANSSRVVMLIDKDSRISLSNNDAGTSNTIFGKSAGDAITSGGNYNVTIGEEAGGALTSGQKNTAVGFESLKTSAENDFSTAIGYQALKTLNEANEGENTAVGYLAGTLSTTTKRSTLIGNQAMGGATLVGTDNTAVGYQAGYDATSASGSVFVGRDAGANITTGNQNIGIGRTALGGAVTTGDNNVAIGAFAGDALTSGKNNVAIGKDAFTRAAAANEIIAIGNNAAGQNTVTTGADGTVAIGFFALGDLSSGANNVAIGYEALRAEDANSENTAVGYQALKTQNGADGNTVVGFRAGLDVTTGAANTFVGAETAANVTTGLDNVMMGKAAGVTTQTTSGSVFIGRSAGNAVTTGNQNIAIGKTALGGAATTGDNNIAIGTNAADALTSGQLGVYIGKNAGGALTTAKENVVIGHTAFQSANSSENFNTVIGFAAGRERDGGDGLTAIGYAALKNLQSQEGNVAVGYQAGLNATTPADSTFIGYQAAGSGTVTGNNNTVLGRQAGFDLTSGANNVFIGNHAGGNATLAGQNVVIGYHAGSGDNRRDSGIEVAWTGDYNVIIGHDAAQTLEGNDSNYNTLVGFEAGTQLTTGAENTLIGAKSANALTTGNNVTTLGYNNDVDNSARSDVIVIGKDLTSAANSHARLGNGTNFVELNFTTSGNNWANTSDIRIKKDIVDGDLGLEFVNKLRTIKYKDKPSSEWSDELKNGIKPEAISTESSDDVMDGLVAQEVKKIADELGTTFSGWQGDEEDLSQKQMLQYDKFVVPLIKAVQELSEKIEHIEKTCKCMKEK